MGGSTYCSFCGKSGGEVEIMVRSCGAVICNECVDVCNTVIEDARRSPQDDDG